MLKILGRPDSINVRKVLWTCVEMDLRYEHEAYGGTTRPTNTPEFLALNPNALVPVIVDDSYVLWESNAICRYLATREARHDLLPQDAAARGLIEQWMDWQATELNTAWRYAFMALVRKSAAHTDPVSITASVESWNRVMRILDAQLARTGAFVAGATFTLADIVIGLATHRWLATPIARPEFPALAAYYARLCERPGFVRFGRDGGP